MACHKQANAISRTNIMNRVIVTYIVTLEVWIILIHDCKWIYSQPYQIKHWEVICINIDVDDRFILEYHYKDKV